MEQMFLTLLEISAASAVVILVITLLSSLINRNFTAKWKYWFWLVFAVRLLIPINFSFESVPARVEVNIPTASITLPAAPAAPVQPINPQPTQAAESAVSVLTTMELLMLVWLAGTVCFLLWQAVNYLRFRRQVIRWGLPVPKDSPIAAVLQQVEAEFEIIGTIPTLICKNVSSPMMIGFFHPLLILPHGEYDAQALSYILRHELTHYKRRDIWYKALMLTACAVHWFNPAVWLMVRESSRDLEISCDAAVMRGAGMEERKQYSETILACIHRELRVKTALSTHFYGGKKTLKERFANILSTKKRRTGAIAFAVVLLCGGIAGGLVACSASSQPEQSAGESVSDEELIDHMLHLYEIDVLPVSWWIGAGTGTLDVDEFADPLENTPEGTTFHPVGRFDSIDAMKQATEQVFTISYAEANLYPNLEAHQQFLERDGKLYINTSAGLGMPPFGPIAATIRTRTADTAILSATFQGPDSEEEQHDVELRLEDGVWKLNSYPYLSDSRSSMQQDIPLDEFVGVLSDSIILSHSWSRADDLHTDSFSGFYYRMALLKQYPEGWEEPLQVPSKDFEDVVTQYFDASIEHLRTAENYNADGQYYSFDYGIGSGGKLEIDTIEENGNMVTVSYRQYDLGDNPIRDGAVTLEKDGEYYRVLSCIVTAPDDVPQNDAAGQTGIYPWTSDAGRVTRLAQLQAKADLQDEAEIVELADGLLDKALYLCDLAYKMARTAEGIEVHVSQYDSAEGVELENGTFYPVDTLPYQSTQEIWDDVYSVFNRQTGDMRFNFITTLYADIDGLLYVNGSADGQSRGRIWDVGRIEIESVAGNKITLRADVTLMDRSGSSDLEVIFDNGTWKLGDSYFANPE